MRRIVLWALSTITTLVLLFSYHTSTSSTVSASTRVTTCLLYTSSACGSV